LFFILAVPYSGLIPIIIQNKLYNSFNHKQVKFRTTSYRFSLEAESTPPSKRRRSLISGHIHFLLDFIIYQKTPSLISREGGFKLRKELKDGRVINCKRHQ
jgi:hypothetical protein